MKLGARSAAWLILLLLTGCFHKKTQVAQNQPVAPPIEDAPKLEPAATNLPPPFVTIPEPAAPKQLPLPSEPVKKPPRHTKKPANTNTQIATTTAPAPVSAAGNLTTNDPPNMRQTTDSLIEQTEKSLNSISRKLDDPEQKIAAQIRGYIKQARDALTSGDVDAAHNLATKAKLLLDELHP
jgi:hypothetical protein